MVWYCLWKDRLSFFHKVVRRGWCQFIWGCIEASNMLQLIAFEVLVGFSLISKRIVWEVSSKKDSEVTIFYDSLAKINSERRELECGFILGVLTFEIIELHLRLSSRWIVSLLDFRKVCADKFVIHLVPFSEGMEIDLSFVDFDLYNVWKDKESLLFVKLINIGFGNKDSCFAKKIILLVERGLIINSKVKIRSTQFRGFACIHGWAVWVPGSRRSKEWTSWCWWTQIFRQIGWIFKTTWFLLGGSGPCYRRK